MSALRVYVAGASAEVHKIAAFMRRLRDAGVTITHDWTPDVIARRGTTDSDLPALDRQRMVSDDLRGVNTTDILWMLVPEGQTIGAWVEFGYASGIGTPTIVSGARSECTIFTAFCRRFPSHEDAFAHVVEHAELRRAADALG